MSNSLRDEVVRFFKEQTGLDAVVVSQISFGEFMIESSDGNIYRIG